MTEEKTEDKLREAVSSYIQFHPAIVASPLDAIFPEVLPQSFKGVGAVISRTFVDRKRDKLGLTGITESRVRIATMGKRKLDLCRASDAIESILAGYKGNMNGIIIKSIALDDQDDDHDETVESHIILSTYVIIHENEE